MSRQYVQRKIGLELDNEINILKKKYWDEYKIDLSYPIASNILIGIMKKPKKKNEPFFKI